MRFSLRGYNAIGVYRVSSSEMLVYYGNEGEEVTLNNDEMNAIGTINFPWFTMKYTHTSVTIDMDIGVTATLNTHWGFKVTTGCGFGANSKGLLGSLDGDVTLCTLICLLFFLFFFCFLSLFDIVWLFEKRIF